MYFRQNGKHRFASSTIKVSLPSDFKYTEMKGYAGSYGSSTEDNSKWTYDKANNTLSYEDAAIALILEYADGQDTGWLLGWGSKQSME